MAEKNTANIGFEKQIWDAACVLRGNMDASEYKNVVLGLIFLKYISDRFDEKYQELVEEGDGFEEDIDEYTSEGIFFVPAGARWSEIAAKAHAPEIGTMIDDAMRAIEKENKRLKDILPKNFARPELDKRRLGDVVDLFTNIQMIEHGSEKDILGRTYEYCLSMFAEQEGKRGGEFFTPSCVVRTLVEVLKPFKGRVYDPCCGSASMMDWQVDDGFRDLLPKMKTDITLTRGERTLIIDAKYYERNLKEQYGKVSIPTDNLYQIFTYVKTKENELVGVPHEKVSGMLLYAQTDEEGAFNNEYQIMGNRICVRTLDLSGDFQSIKSQLDDIAEKYLLVRTE